MNNKNSILRKRRPSKSNPLPFGVSVRKAGRRTLLTPVTEPSEEGIVQQPVEQVGAIQGKKVGSLYEWRLAKALDAAGLSYQYQVSVYGGRSVRGGQVLDFLVDTVPLPTPVFADGEHWHQGTLAREDSYKRALLNADMAGQWNPWISLYGPDLWDQDAANRAVRELLL
jgi:hypothetical protein